MKSASARMPLRLRRALLIVSVAVMATQVSGASAAAQLPGAQLLVRVASVQLNGSLSLLAGPPASGSWALLIAGLVGGWAIGRRRVSAPGNLALDASGLQRR